MPEFKRLAGKFAYSGMDIHHPPDLLPPDKCVLMFNLQPDIQSGALAMRPPITPLATVPEGFPVNSLVRMNDSVPGAAIPFSRFAGVHNSIYSGAGGALTPIEAGYSGNPLAMVPYRPPLSPEPWLYVYDSLQQRRYKTNQTAQNIGIAAPTTEPSAVRIQPLYKLAVGTEVVGSWLGITPVAGAIGATSAVARVPAAATVGVIVYDSGSTGMACIAPTASNYTWMTSKAAIIIGSEQVYIEEIFPGFSGTQVDSIQYDSGSTGACTIVPSAALPGLRRNQLILLNSAVSVRVTSVTAAPDGTYSFRCNTGGSTIIPGHSIMSAPNFRVWTSVNHAAGAAITGNAIAATLTPTITGGSMSAVITSPLSQDLSQISGRPIGNEDYVHLALLFDHPEWVTEVHVMLDVSDGNFIDNYFYYVIRQSDFGQSALGGSAPGSVATIQAQLSAIEYGVASQLAPDVLPTTAQPNYPTPEVPSSSSPDPQVLDTGQSVWVDTMFKVNDLTRVGTNMTFGLQNVVKVGVLIYTSGGIVTAQVASPYVSGGYGPDCNFNTYGPQAPPIQWRYRYRNILTGAHSTVSPETRNGETLRRQGINLTCPNSPDPQVDTVDWERRGGTNPDWHYVGSVPQGQTFLDNVTESAAQIGDALEVKSYQPWPVTDVPRTGTALVVGTSVSQVSGDTFNLRWLRGTEFIVGGNTYSLYAPPNSATRLQLAQSVPVSGTYTFSIPEATIEGQPIYGCWLDEANNRICGVGDPLNPGLMYFSNNDNPDGASDGGYLEVTSPSEPLLNGFYAEGSNYAFSSSSLYKIESTPGAANPYASYRLSGVEGLAGPWAFDAQRRLLFYWGPDGIYVYSFGALGENLTREDLYPLFPHAGIPQGSPGVPISVRGVTIYPPDYSLTSRMRISFSEGFVYATYQNSNGVIDALVYSLGAKGWRKDTYSPSISLFVLEKGTPNPVLMAGGADGNLYQIDQTGVATTDVGGPIEWHIITPCKDGGDSRANKQWGDLLLDYSTAGATPIGLDLFVTWDNLLVDGVTAAIPLSTNRTQQIFNLIAPPQLADSPIIHRNMALSIEGDGPILLYEWQPSYLLLPEDTTARVSDWQHGGTPHYKFIQGFRLHADTGGQNKRVQIEYEGGLLGPVVTINHNGEEILPYSWSPPFKAHIMRIVPLDNVPWRYWTDTDWIFELEPEPANYWISQPTSFDLQGFLHMRELWPAYAGAQGGIVSLSVDGATAIPIAGLQPSGAPVKPYFPCPPLKGKLWQLSVSGTGLQLYERDTEFLVKSWGDTGPYRRLKPFGDRSGGGGSSGARI